LLRRGPYIIAAGLDEAEDLPVRTIEGEFVDLFSPRLEIQRSVTLGPNVRVFLLDMAMVDRNLPMVLASASKVLEAQEPAWGLKFHSEGPEATTCATRLVLHGEPKSVKVNGAPISWEWDPDTHTALLTYPNSPDGVWVEVAT